MTRIFLIAASLIWASLASAGGNIAETYAGKWRGVGLQEGASSWLVQLDLGVSIAYVEYPDFPCGGVWEYSVEISRKLSAMERLGYGQSLCIDNSPITIEALSPSQLMVVWFSPTGAEMAIAVLHRDTPSKNNRAAEESETTLTRMSRNLGLGTGPACLPAATS